MQQSIPEAMSEGGYPGICFYRTVECGKIFPDQYAC